MRYRKKPVVIEAVQLTPESCWDYWKDGILFLGRFPVQGNYNSKYQTISKAWVTISTLEGDMKADLFDWVIKGVKGELYPCKPDIFEATYEAVP